ncbi:Myb-like DNA-binding domain protein [Apophysomyces ossiformis]|uniref:Myb-like DNA-binding domain protein n=1 Tax=Apophysomyces ossiformis TaxID=679940 RepID=A0A8H7EV77_9FUNG|nr:Myb-like DNA-binding domain protein [Apophysomyces ossiformis]
MSSTAGARRSARLREKTETKNKSNGTTESSDKIRSSRRKTDRRRARSEDLGEAADAIETQSIRDTSGAVQEYPPNSVEGSVDGLDVESTSERSPKRRKPGRKAKSHVEKIKDTADHVTTRSPRTAGRIFDGDLMFTSSSEDEKSECELAPAEEQAEEDKIADLIDAILQLQSMGDIPGSRYPRDRVVIEETLRLNELMQQEAEEQIARIDELMKQNEMMAREVCKVAALEARLEKQRVEIHKKYTEKLNFFVDTDGETPFDTSPLIQGQEKETDEGQVVKPKTWTLKERERLTEAIHQEAQRVLAYEHVQRNEAWRVWEVDKADNNTLENIPVNKIDWRRVSSLYVKTRSSTECMIQWTTQEHPKINKKPWTKSESQKLLELVSENGVQGTWHEIAVKLGTNRTAAQCFSHYQAGTNNKHSKRRWSKEDDDALRESVGLIGDRNWQQVAAMVGERTGQQCLQRWMKSLDPAIRRSKWTEEENTALRAAVAVYGVGNWNMIQRHLPGRTDMQCRERWTNILDPTLVRTRFTEEEIERLKELVEIHGKKWSVIAQHMPGRTDNHVFREYKSLQAKEKKRRANTQAKGKD